ncbi:MAG TPA: DNA-processing protein DprA [Tepidisphaeraceae bacterium]|nr:DNA-processing protein DprA [Tepidisphaeraceae bacterium]
MIHHWLQLSLTSGIGPILGRRLIDAAGSAEAAVQLTRRELQQIEGIGLAKAQTVADSLKSAEADAILQLNKANQLGATLLCPDDESWPALLRPLPAAPLILFILGNLQPRDLQSLAIVGSRRCTHYGREQSERFAALLAGAGFTVISGGARGVDSAAHRGAMQHPHGRTIAVLGSGLDVPYPPENKPLFDQIAQRGALVSEFPFGTPPNAENFPRRNRIVSGLSRGVLVIEADERSGALITARLANEEHGRPVFALPGRVDNPMAAGPHLLIRDGATLTTKLEDIISALDPLPDGVHQPGLFPTETHEEKTRPTPPTNLSDRQQLILNQIGHEASAVDEIIDKTNLPAPAVLQELTFLTLRGLLKRAEGQTYVKV